MALAPSVCGVNLDSQTQCEHYHGPTDIIAIKMRCCGLYYACKDCHETLADHPIAVWPESEWNQQAVLCGACGAMLTILKYMQVILAAQLVERNSILGAAATIIFTLKFRRFPSRVEKQRKRSF